MKMVLRYTKSIRNLRWVGLPVVCLIAILIIYYRGQNEDQGPVKLGLEDPGVHLEHIYVRPDWRQWIAFDGSPTSWDYIKIYKPNGYSFFLDDLTKIKGLVTINNSQDALQFVRLRTSLVFWQSFKEPCVEIINPSQSSNLPTFGITTKFNFHVSGYHGVLSDIAYQAGQFQPPGVERQGNTYSIKRWLLGPSPHHVSWVQETVGKHGEYTFKVLRELEAPHLPDTTWEYTRYKLGE